MRVSYAGVVMDGTTKDDEGATWLVTGLSGWESAPVRSTSLAYSSKDGATRTRPSYDAKPMVLSGICKTTGGEEGFWSAYNRLLSLTADLFVERDLVVSENVDKTVSTTLADQPRIAIKYAHFEFELSLIGMDPRKYGAWVSKTIPAGGSSSLTNDGNAFSEAVRLTTGSDGMVKVTNQEQGKTLTTGPNSVDDGTVIDMRARTVYQDEKNRYGRLSTSSQWWSLAPGKNTIKNDGETSLTIQYRPAWA